MANTENAGSTADVPPVRYRVSGMDCAKDAEATPEPMVLINPQVIWSSVERSVYDEGCLSIPDQYAEVERPASVKVSWTDLDGREVQETFDDLWATCVQHEIDHLDGKLFIDRLVSRRNSLNKRIALSADLKSDNS